MLSIQDLPLEIITKILLLGCDEFGSNAQPLRKATTRRLKLFAKLAASVCRDWHDIVTTRSGYRFWYTNPTFGLLKHGSSIKFDIAAAEFKYQLQTSQNCDMDIYFAVGWEEDELYTEELEPLERLSIHVFLMLIPYARQIRAMEIRSRPLTQLLFAIHSLGKLPRLEFFKLRGREGHSINHLESLLSPHYPNVPPLLDLPFSGDSIAISLKYWDVFGLVRMQHSISRLKLTYCWTHGHQYTNWEDLRLLLLDNPNITDLDLKTYDVRDSAKPSQEKHSSAPAKPKICMPRWETASLTASPETICTLFSHFIAPALRKVRLALGDGEVLRYGPPLNTKNMMHLPSLTELRLFFESSTWTQMHDDCLVGLLPPQLSSLTILFSNTPHVIQLWPSSRPQITIHHLYVHMQKPTKTMHMLSRWNPVHLQISFLYFKHWVLAGLPSSERGVLFSMSQLSLLDLLNAGMTELLYMLSAIDTPALRKVVISTEYVREAMAIARSSAEFIGAKGAVQSIRDLDIQERGPGSAKPFDLFDEFHIGEFKSLETLVMRMHVTADSGMAVLLKLFQKLREGHACPRLSQMTFEVTVTFYKSTDGAEWDEQEHTLRTILDELVTERGGTLVATLDTIQRHSFNS